MNKLNDLNYYYLNKLKLNDKLIGSTSTLSNTSTIDDEASTQTIISPTNNDAINCAENINNQIQSLISKTNENSTDYPIIKKLKRSNLPIRITKKSNSTLIPAETKTEKTENEINLNNSSNSINLFDKLNDYDNSDPDFDLFKENLDDHSNYPLSVINSETEEQNSNSKNSNSSSMSDSSPSNKNKQNETQKNNQKCDMDLTDMDIDIDSFYTMDRKQFKLQHSLSASNLFNFSKYTCLACSFLINQKSTSLRFQYFKSKIFYDEANLFKCNSTFELISNENDELKKELNNLLINKIKYKNDKLHKIESNSTIINSNSHNINRSLTDLSSCSSINNNNNSSKR